MSRKRIGGETRLHLADKQKGDGREPKLGAVARSRKMRTGNKIKTNEVMLKIISPGEVERAVTSQGIHGGGGSVDPEIMKALENRDAELEG